MKYFLLTLTLLFSFNAMAFNGDGRCFIDTQTNITASGIGVTALVASGTRSCLFIVNKGTGSVFINPVASSNATDGIEILGRTTFAPGWTPTNSFIIYTSTSTQPVTVDSGYFIP